MSDPSGGIPELETYNHQENRPKGRLEMEQWIRDKIPKVHWLRIIACKLYHLSKPISWDMREIVLKHWLLDEMIRRQQITGDLLGVNQNASNDEGELRQFQQKLRALIETGQAIQPHHAEGVDMSFSPPPPPNMNGTPAPQNGQQQQYAAPPGPPAPPMPAGPPQGYGQPPMPQQTQIGGPGFQAPPPPQQVAPPPMGPPGYGPPPGPPMGGPPMTPPPSAPPQQAAGGRGRRKAEGAQMAPPPAAPVPPMSGPPGAPAGFAPLPASGPSFGPPPTIAAPPQAQHSQAAPSGGVDLGPVLQRLDALQKLVESQAAQIAALSRLTQLDSMALTILGRAMYQKPGTAVVADFLTEIGQPIPQ